MEKKKTRKILNTFLFYSIVSLTGVIVVPTLGILAPTFILCGIITPILEFIKVIGYIFKIDMPIAMFQIGEFTPNPILEFLLSILIAVVLYVIGIYIWKLLLTYIHMVIKNKEKILI